MSGLCITSSTHLLPLKIVACSQHGEEDPTGCSHQGGLKQGWKYKFVRYQYIWTLKGPWTARVPLNQAHRVHFRVRKDSGGSLVNIIVTGHPKSCCKSGENCKVQLSLMDQGYALTLWGLLLCPKNPLACFCC